MLKKKYYYLIHLQYLGFRYHGWQKQPEVKTVQYMLERTLCFILGHDNFRTLGASRTDSMVSAHHHLSEVFSYEKLDVNQLYRELNLNLPADIKALKVEEVDKDFKIIASEKKKEYHYYFSYGEKVHPFCAPFLINYFEPLNIELMQLGAQAFEGTHNFKSFCYRPNENKTFERSIDTCRILKNDVLTASFFPENSYYLKIIGNGFLHHQVRMMMGCLLKLGMGHISLDEVKSALKKGEGQELTFIAPASGLHLIQNELSDE